MTNDKDGAALLREGPAPIPNTRLQCFGCKHLETKDWREPSGDGETFDRGTSADCKAIPGGQNIGVYWSRTNDAPKWCPFLPTLKSHGQAFDAAGVREACAKECEKRGHVTSADAIRALPIPEAPASVEPEPPEIEQVYIAQGINADGGPPWNWYVVGPEGEVAYCQTEDGENHAHMIAVALNDRVHILREDLKKYQAEPDTIGWNPTHEVEDRVYPHDGDTIGSNFGNGGGFDPVADHSGDATYLICKGGAYYRPNAQGYTRNRSEAGRYTLEEAISYSHPNGPDGPRDGITYELDTATPSPGFGGGDLREAIHKALSSELGDTYDCGRVWDAWHVGTMGEDDFTPVNDRVDEITETVLAALPPVKQSVGSHIVGPLSGGTWQIVVVGGL